MKKIIFVLLLALITPLCVFAQADKVNEDLIKAKAEFASAESQLKNLAAKNTSVEAELKAIIGSHAVLKETALDARRDITNRERAENFIYQTLTYRLEDLYEDLYNLKKKNEAVYYEAYKICNHLYWIELDSDALNLYGIQNAVERQFPFLEVHDVTWLQENDPKK